MTKLKFVLGAALAVVAVAAGVTPASAAIDTTAPVLAAFTFTPGSVDVAAGSDQVVISARVTDATGAVAPGYSIRSDATTQSFTGDLVRVSGTALDGVYEATVDIPATAAAGSWTVSVSALADTVGNDDRTVHTNATKLVVSSNATDTAPPVLQSFTFTPSPLNVTTGPKQVTVSARLTDATGAVAPTATISSDTSTQAAQGNLALVSGTPQDGIYQGTVDIPATAAPGAWTVSLSALRDIVGNDDRTIHRNATKLSVVSNAIDVSPPALTSFSFTPTSVDASVDLNQAGGASVVVTARVTDASGAVPPVAILSSDTTAQTARGTLTLVSGTPQAGTYQGTVNLPATAAPGSWTVALDELRDPLGNTDRTVHRHATKLDVTNDDVAKAPSAPTGVTATRGDQSATVSWTAASPNRSAVTGYTITASPGGATQTVAGNVLTGTVTGLINGISYTFTVKATNAVGTSQPSAPSTAITPAGVPSAPTGVSAVRGDKSAQVSWNVPVVNGSPITSYTITASPGGATATVAGDKTVGTVTGLANNTSYTFTVKATNAIGTSPASAVSNAVIPTSVPSAPTLVTATRGDRSAVVTWRAPTTNATGLTGYTVTASPGGATQSVGGSTLTATFTGLTNGTAYTFTVSATNATGPSPQSDPSAPVTPAAAPLAPTGVTATRADKGALVSWTAANENGSPVTGYTITVSPGGASQTVGGSVTSTTITGLTNGTPYTFTVRATNVLGTSPASTASAPVTPGGAPTAPNDVQAVRGNGSVRVSWSASVENGTPITGYTITTSPGGATVTVPGTQTTGVVSGLSNSTSYSFTVTATNAAGTSPASAPSNLLGPAGVPGVPYSLTTTAQDGAALLSWAAPNDNGAPISGYVITASPGGRTWNVADSPSHAVLTGLANGTAYTFTIQAVNAIGTSAPSADSPAVTPGGTPGRVRSASAVATKRVVTIRWKAPVTNGSAITGYTVTPSRGASVSVGGSSLVARFKGLKAGTYTFVIRAENAIGEGPGRKVRVQVR